ncbi:amino acid permease [Mycobacterium aquaticum]|uniref:Amino acid permease n=1 Tax=Mycobacterium aquaticum TaxID=1927124 RepID=A0A1X0B4W0_9MYCO|nr:amino acid permease [Mycobacterium aquaticum]
MNNETSEPTAVRGFARRIGILQATAINMSQMVGTGPFITIPLMVGVFGGPQAILGWIVGAILAICDGLVWAELGAAMPGAGGTYVYLREAFQYRTGRLMPFMFVWTAIVFIPLIMSTGVTGFVQYLTYLWPSMTQTDGDIVGLAMCVAVAVLLWRRIESIGKLTVVLWSVMIVSVLSVIVAAFSHFHSSLAFAYPVHAFSLGSSSFWAGLGLGLIVGIYDYLGYNTSSYLGAEVKDPGRVLPRSILYSVICVMAIYLLMQIGILGVVPWRDMIDPNNPASQSVAAVVLQQAWGKTAASIVTVLILIASFASVLTGLLGGSRVPYDAANDRLFFSRYARLNRKGRFPQFSLVTMVAITAFGFIVSRHLGDSSTTPPLTVLIGLLTTVMVIVQAAAQIAALTVLRRRQPQLKRPYKMWLYPLPSIIALVAWGIVYGFADKASPGVHPIEWSLAWIALGVVAYLVWAAAEHTWPFGPKEIHEEFLEAQMIAEAAASAGSGRSELGAGTTSL